MNAPRCRDRLLADGKVGIPSAREYRKSQSRSILLLLGFEISSDRAPLEGEAPHIFGNALQGQGMVAEKHMKRWRIVANGFGDSCQMCKAKGGKLLEPGRRILLQLSGNIDDCRRFNFVAQGT